MNEKMAKYLAGEYTFKAPPVCTAHWTDTDWVKYIDAYNGFDPRSQWGIESYGREKEAYQMGWIAAVLSFQNPDSAFDNPYPEGSLKWYAFNYGWNRH
jgi:hypothetical protein